MFCIFLCKQRTAYEMRISDWSSDVCSSDLHSLDMKRQEPIGDHALVAHPQDTRGVPGLGEQLQNSFCRIVYRLMGLAGEQDVAREAICERRMDERRDEHRLAGARRPLSQCERTSGEHGG